jgi:outer membrane biosynthesis protein TonB
VSDITNVSAAVEETDEEQPPTEEEVVEEQTEPEPQPQQTAALPDPVLELPEPEAEFLPEEDAEPEPEPEEVAEEPEPEPEPQAPPPNVQPSVRPQPPERRNEFDFDQAAALIDRAPREEEPEFDLENLDLGDQTNVQTADEARSAVGLGTGLTISQMDALKSDIQRCWNVPAGARDAENLRIELRVHFNPDGTVRRVEVLDTIRYNTDSFYRAAADSARRAVERCQNGTRFDGSYRQGYDLPREQYDTWRTVRLTFDPQEML